MNNGRLWTVVNPTVGIPLLLGAVAVTSLIVHAAVLFNTHWYPAFYSGSAKKVALNTTAAPVLALDEKTASNFTVAVTPAPATEVGGQTTYVITVAPKATASVDTAATNMKLASVN
jgi:light-harvesting protein B-800-850 alpha chain